MIVPIFPPLDGSASERFTPFARALKTVQAAGDRASIAHLLEEELAWCATNQQAGEQRLIYEACLRVLTDLVRLRWRLVEQGYGFALENPRELRRSGTVAELVASKAALRDELRPGVEEQLLHPAVRDFLRRIEADARGKRTVRCLVADPGELRDRLDAACRSTGADRVAVLRSAIQPYLQRATDDPDPITGQSLREIWRYFRYGWSIPQVAVPGRQLLYLVRDAAHQDHPVIGIASLNNCPLEMGEARETYIGWHRKALEDRFASAVTEGAEALEREVGWLEGRLATSLGEVEWGNLVTPEEVAEPTEAVVRRLKRRGQDFARLREDLLREAAIGDGAGFDPLSWVGDLAPPVDDDILRMEAKASVDARMHAARKQLVAKKRAHALGRLLQARMTLREHRPALVDPDRALSTLRSEAVNSAVNIVVEALKARRAGANMLELTTCGAIEPYARLLGGKLVALLMLSPQVGADYRDAYGAPSIISSQMRNQPVVRDNSLVLLGTTSLYVHGSSQYNRLRLPAGVIAADQPEIRYNAIGSTTGFGTVQFSPQTSRAIDARLSARDSYKEVNSVFGEGTSPKLRKLKTGLRSIGFDPDRLLRHRQQRLIYVMPLWEGARDWLLERTTELPSYVADPAAFRGATERIAEFWRARWLAGRLDRIEPAATSLAESCASREKGRQLTGASA